VAGYPARPQRDWLRAEAHLHRLPDLLRKIRELERRTSAGRTGGEDAS
jgi:UDP-3-O-[3-hydroxymyristoyl] glucosamine N-acyltransferase